MSSPTISLSSMCKDFAKPFKTKALRKVKGLFARKRLSPSNSSSSEVSIISQDSMEFDIGGAKTILELWSAFHDPSVLDIRRNKKYNLVEPSMDSYSCLSSPDMNNAEPASTNSSTATLVESRIVKAEDLKTLKVLGSGSFGRVYEVRDQISRVRMALKVVSKEALSREAYLAVLNEQATLRTLADSSWQLTIEASWHDSSAFYILMPVYPIDLDSMIYKFGPFPKDVCQFYAAELTIAVNELHQRGIIHRDIKTPNILLDAEGHIVLADLGLSKNFGRAPSLQEFVMLPYWPLGPQDTYGMPHRDPSELTFVTDEPVGSPLELAPEVFLGKHYCFGTDRWGSAIVTYKMATGRHPWYSDDDDELMRLITTTDLVFRSTDNVDDDTQDFLQAMLRKEPAERLHVGVEMESHPFFAGVNWVLMEQRAVPTPWIPGENTSHVIFDKVDPFIPGTSYTLATDPHPDFIYTSDRLKVAAVNCEDEDSKVASLVSVAEKSPRNKFTMKDILRKIGFSKQDYNPVTTATSLSVPPPLPSLTYTDSYIFEDIDLDKPDSKDQPLESIPLTSEESSTSVFSQFKLWFRKIRTPKTHRPNNNISWNN